MKKKCFSEAQIVSILKEGEADISEQQRGEHVLPYAFLSAYRNQIMQKYYIVYYHIS